jgi:SIR2-like protein
VNEKELTAFLDSALRACQECIATNPVIILGSGASAPFGLPTMNSLGESIAERVEETIAGISADAKWQQFKSEMVSVGLEPALQKGLLNDCPEVYQTIVRTAWIEVAGPDVLAWKLTVRDPDSLPLTSLLRHLFHSDHRNVVVVTTNYGRLVEYAAGVGSFLYRTGFNPGYVGAWRANQQALQYCSGSPPNRLPERIVEIWKVHGSLDWFKRSEETYAIPVGQELPEGLIPLIVPPGLIKYQETHQEPFRTVLDRVDRALINANGFFCIGYGFNDEHIHLKLIHRVEKDKKPIVILAKKLTARALLFRNSGIRFVAMEKK